MIPSPSDPQRSGVTPGCPVQRDGPPSTRLGATSSNSQAAVDFLEFDARVPPIAQPSGLTPGCPVQRDGSTLSHNPSRAPQMDGNSARVSPPQLGFAPSDALPSGGFPKISSNYDQAVGIKSKSNDQTNSAAAAQPGFQPPQPNSGDTQHKSSHDVQQIKDKPQTAQPSFADIAARKTAKPSDLFAHRFSAIIPVKDDEGVTVIMPQTLYDKRILLFQFALIGRILLPPGSSPRSSEDYKVELSKIFQTTGEWNLLHLGKGFFSLQFRLQEDQLRAVRHKSWRLSTGTIHLRDWQPNFDPYKECSSTTQIWVRLYHLPTEYWHPEFLVGIFRSVGTVIKLDGNTAQGLVGHFARALVEVDLSKPLLDSVRVGLLDNLFFVDFSYENVPLLCSFCHYIGHSVDQCRKAKVTPDVGGGKDEGKHRTAPARKKKKWVAIEGEQQQANRIVPVGTVIEKIHNDQGKLATSNAFDALQNLVSGDETVPETPLTVGDIMDLATGSAGAVSEELAQKLLAAAKECSMNRQLRLERAAQPDISAAVSANPDSGEAMSPTAPTAEPPSSDQKTAAGNDPSPSREETAAVPAETAADLQSDSMPSGEGTPIPSKTHVESARNNLVDQPPAQAKSITKRTKNKRKVTAALPKRQLRSSTRNKTNSEITPEMIEEYARNQCHYVPTDSLGQPKAIKVAPNSPHPKSQLEAQLRAAAALGKYPTAYVLDTGQKGALKSMDFVANQQWDDIPHTEAYTDSDINSD